MSALVLVYRGERWEQKHCNSPWSDLWCTSKAVLGCSKADWLPQSPTPGLMLGAQKMGWYEVSLHLEQLGTEAEIPTLHYKVLAEGGGC